MSTSQETNGQIAQDITTNRYLLDNNLTEAETTFESPYSEELDLDNNNDDVSDSFVDSGYLEDSAVVASTQTDFTSFERYLHNKNTDNLSNPGTFDDFDLFGGAGDASENTQVYNGGYIFTDDDATDIASVKPNHGSIYRDARNMTMERIEGESSNALMQSYTSLPQGPAPVVEEELYGDEHVDTHADRFEHHYSHLEDGKMDSFGEWTDNYERYESIAYQPSSSSGSAPQLQIRRYQQSNVDRQDS